MRHPLIVLSVILTLLGFAPMSTLAQENLGRTNIRYVLPFGPDGLNASLTATETVEGSCTSDSLSTPARPDAWDCIGENDRIYDPCFENPFANPDEAAEVACFADPFSTEVVLVQLDGPLMRTKEAPGQAQSPLAPWDVPWGLELANGDRCILLDHIDITLAGDAVYYSCADGGSILGEVDRSQPVWSVNYLEEGSIASQLVDVTAAWS